MRALPICLLLAGCSSGGGGETSPPILEECVVGPWIQSEDPCAEGVFCGGTTVAQECLAVDCQELGLIFLDADRTYWEGIVLNAPNDRTFTRWLSADPRVWATSGQTLSLGGDTRSTTCSGDEMTWGVGEFVPAWPGPEPRLRAGLEAAQQDSGWIHRSY